MHLLEAARNDAVTITFVIIVLGALLGRLRVAGISLGSSGVLFVALLFGNFGWIPKSGLGVLGSFGVVLFVYAIGLQAGPRFLQTLRGKGAVPLIVGLATVVGGAVCAGLVGWLLHVDKDLIVGIFAGALTSTPALAAATEASQSPLVSVAYGLAYPFGVITVVLFAQLAPSWCRRVPGTNGERPDTPASPAIAQRCYLVQNPGCIGKSIDELHLHELAQVNISRILRDEKMLATARNVVLQKNDIVLAVGTSRELDRLTLIIGPPVPAEVEMTALPNVIARDVFISERSFAGHSLRTLHLRTKHGVVVTRVRREGLEFVPRGEFMLEIGDQVRVVGYEPDVLAFSAAAGIREQRIHETGIPQFAVGLVLGLGLGLLPIPILGFGTIKLGMAGGPLFMGLLLGHFGRIGRLRVHVPIGARYLMRELGLALFLAHAGTAAGSQLIEVLQANGFQLVLLAIVAAVFATLLGFGLAYWVFRQSVASTLGLTCGAMTSTPGLGAASAQFESDVPALSYAAVYPLALVAMTIVAQLMLAVLP